MHEGFGVVGLLKPLENKNFNGLKLNELLEEKKISLRCGLQVVNQQSCDVEHNLSIDGIVEEIYYAEALPNVVQLMAQGFKTSEIHLMISIQD